MSIYEKNLEALSSHGYESLKEALKELKPRKYRYILNDDILATNIIDDEGESLYIDPLKELDEDLKEYEEKYIRYPFIYYFGLGNCILCQAMLKNKLLEKLVVFEAELELIYLALKLFDFSKEILKGRFIIIYASFYTQALSNIVINSDMIRYARTYELLINSPYYLKHFNALIDEVNKQNLKQLKELSLFDGNMPTDSMQGVFQFIYNLPKLISHPTMESLIKKRGKKAKTALICATGPSLTKQLALLKKYQENIVIFSVDASFMILMKEGIVPDYVLNFERVKESAAFFKDYQGEKEKDIVFITTSIAHKQTIAMLEEYKRFFILALRSLNIDKNMSFLAPFKGYTAGGSVAHMAAGAAIQLGFENLVFIGQDLAYAKDGSTHGKGHIYEGQFDPGDRIKVLAYGGEGEVLTNFFWDSFKSRFTHMATIHKNIRFINSTQGGSRILEFEEMPFKQALEELASVKINKALAKPKAMLRKEQNKLLVESYNYIKKTQAKSSRLLKACKKISKRVDAFINGSFKYTADELIKELDSFKALQEKKSYLGAIDVLMPTISQNERILTPLYTKIITNEADRQNQSIAWIYSHDAVLKDYLQQLQVQEGLLKECIIPLRDLCEKRKLV